MGMPSSRRVRRMAILAAVILLPAALAWAGPQVVVTARHGQSLRGSVEELPFVVLRGSREERAEAFGALAGPDLVTLLNETLIPAAEGRMRGGWGVMVMLTKARFAFTPEEERDFAAFVRGFAAASAPEQRRLTALGRELSVDDLKVAQCFADLPAALAAAGGGCSSFSAWGSLTPDGEVITGRNADYTTFPGRFPMMVVAQQPAEEGVPATLEISGPGVFGASSAMNETGVTLLVHDEAGLPGPNVRFRPRILVLRQAIERARPTTAAEDVAAALRGQPPAMGGNIHVSVPRGAAGDALPAVVEWDRNEREQGASIRRPEAGAEAIFCTNHFLARRDPPTDENGSSPRRFRRLAEDTRRARQAGATIDVAAAQRMMDAVAVRGGSMTYMSMIILPAQRRAFVARAAEPGASATDGPWVEIVWDDLFAAK